MARVYASHVIDAPIATIWAYMRDFGSLAGWFPGVTDLRIEGGRSGTDVGCVRSFTSNNRYHVREQLLALSDRHYCCTYRMLDGPLVDYTATVRLLSVTEGNRTFVQWSAEFGCEVQDQDKWTTFLIQRCYQPAFRMLADRFSGARKSAGTT